MARGAGRIAGTIAILGAGLMGSCAALALAGRGARVVLFDRRDAAMMETSRATEGKVHLGFVYAADPSLRTARLMQRGAAAFAPRLEEWLGPGALAPLLSEPFVYGVHRDSQLPPAAIETHFGRIAANWAGPPEVLAWSRMPEAELALSFDPDLVVAAYRTAEVAVDAGRLAPLLRAALAAEPRIELRTGVSIDAVEGEAGAFRVRAGAASGPILDGPFDQVVNCLWANRPAVDIASGLPPPERTLTRHKLSAWLRLAKPPPPGLCATTFVLGPFGDIVLWPNGLLYASWYPAGLVRRTTRIEQTDWYRIRQGIDVQAIAGGTVEALSRLCPPLAGAVAGARPVVDGGAITALGETDIDDPGSRLHQRSAVGVVAARPGYHSVDTGKFTLAPLFAAELASRVAGDA